MLALAQLLRLPNIFTVVADLLMVGWATGVLWQSPGQWILALVMSCCLYFAGMVSNDIFDRHEDAKARPFRPIPSGRVTLRTAIILAITLTVVGIGCGVLAGGMWGWLVGLVAAIFLYNGLLKSTPLGPVVMGLCRWFHVAFAVSLTPSFPAEVSWHLASIIGVYIIGVTWFARTEEFAGRPRDLIPAALVMLLALVGVVLLPLHESPIAANRLVPYCIAAYVAYLVAALLKAIRDPRPKNVQAGVKRSILGLMALDAIIASHFIGWPAVGMLFLYLPARVLGKKVYST
ncbi:MAG: UbiA family prenyltransferase [Fimbriiglobus sp.]